ncbi:MAG: branched-chain amino acid ABC transporter substrate-binding protein [Synechococcaceae bacterium WB9_2_112]|nr:branched-chain amino acid ABC transporter substrate-binding protein [Synechococcaceae bacterium WB9_2_112]
MTSSPATPSPTGRRAVRSDERRRGVLRLASLLLAGIGAIAWLGRSADPASRPLAAGPLSLGAAIALTGNANLYGQDQRIGLALAERWAQQDAAGGRAVRVWLEDGASDEPSAIAAFNLLIRQGVIALIGPTLSQQAFAADPIAQRQGVPVVAPSNTAKGIPQIGHFISRVSAQSSVIAPLSIDEALRRDPSIQRVAVFYAHDDAYSTAEVQIFDKALAARGLTPVTVQRTQLADNDFQTPITNALQRAPQLVVLSVQAVAGGNLIRQLRELGYRGQIVVGNGLNTPNIYPICQRWCDGILIAQAYSPELNTPINRDFQRLYRQARGDRRPPQITAQAFTAYQVLHEAIQRLHSKGGLTGVTLGQARVRLMHELLAGRYETPLGPIGFSPEGEVQQQRFYVAEVRMDPSGRDGRFALVGQRSLNGARP